MQEIAHVGLKSRCMGNMGNFDIQAGGREVREGDPVKVGQEIKFTVYYKCVTIASLPEVKILQAWRKRGGGV